MAIYDTNAGPCYRELLILRGLNKYLSAASHSCYLLKLPKKYAKIMLLSYANQLYSTLNVFLESQP